MKLNLEEILGTGKRLVCASVLAGALIAGSLTACAKPSTTIQPTPETQVLSDNASIEDVIKKSQDNTLISIYGNPRAETVAMYILVSKNRYGKELHNVSADLYLLQLSTGEYARLSYNFTQRSLPPNSEMQPYWALKGDSKLNSMLKNSMTVGIRITDTPLEMVFIRSDEGTFEVKPSKQSILLWEGSTGRFNTYDRVSQDLHDVFKSAKVPIPER